MPRNATYLFGRLNIIAMETDKSAIYSKAFSQSAPSVRRYAHTWGFSDVEVLRDEELGDFFEGFLVKYKDQQAVEVVDTDAKALVDENVRNLVAAHARFFLHPSTGLIAYHPVGTEISGPTFIARFGELVEQALDRFFVSAEILPINDTETWQQALNRFSRIDRLKIYLHPSNPSNRHLWKRIDERLRGMHVKSYREEYQGSTADGGLRPNADRSIGRKIAMAEDGYGYAEVVGVRDGKEGTLSTRDRPLTSQAPNDSESPEVVLRALKDIFCSILKRFQK